MSLPFNWQGGSSNPVVRSFFDEFRNWPHNYHTEFVASLQNKLGAFLTNEKLQRVLDPKAKLNLRKIMDEGKVLIVNLSKGHLGENASDLLGTLLVTNLQLAATTRANIPESDRRDFSIIIDEFQNYATPSIATFVSEARKYRIHLILANQFTQWGKGSPLSSNDDFRRCTPTTFNAFATRS